tara:strand:+ start:346 stop:861 length:516 start_codon:yes stop_codon:yes gene_type:complete
MNIRRTGVPKTLKALGGLLSHINKTMPPCKFEGLSWVREEHPESRAALFAADVPEEFFEDKLVEYGFPQKITVEILRFAPEDHIDLHRHKAAASSILIPGQDTQKCTLLEFEFFSDHGEPKGSTFLQRSRAYQIRPGIWHSIKRVGEGDYVYLFSASAPIIGNDIVWYADQ